MKREELTKMMEEIKTALENRQPTQEQINRIKDQAIEEVQQEVNANANS